MPDDKERKLSDWVYAKFKQAYVAKAPIMEKWKKYMSAYEGDLFKNDSRPDYKSNQVSNLIFSTIEAIRPIMTDNNPKFIAVPNNPEGMQFSNDVQMALDFEWDREKMSTKLPAQLIPMLVYGTAIWFVSWDGSEGEYGNIKLKAVDPFNLFPDPLAEDVEGSEFIVYATYQNANQIKQKFPDKASAIEGSRISMSELVANRDENDSNEENQVLILEMWCRDWITTDKSIEGEEKLKYPGGRVITCLPELGIVLSDKKNPYKDGKFPFVLMKNYDVPFKFWGVGEVEQILSPQIYVNELTNQIIDNAKNTANMQWIIDKNSGIGQGKLTNRPGLVIRKNPGSEVRRDTPPAMPTYVREQIDTLKADIQDISGVLDSLKGDKQTGISAASAILALQEASQSRIRLKIKIMECNLTELANMVYSRMQQFWKLDRWVRITDVEGNPSFQKIGQQVLTNDFDMKVMAGSTMPVNKNAMMDLMIRLAQTNAEDGMPVVDRKAILEYLPVGDKKAITDRFAQLQQQQQEQQQAQLQQEQAMQQQQQEQQMAQQQQGMQTEDRQQLAQLGEMMQQFLQTLDMTSKQVDELILDKEGREKKQKDSEIEEKGYKRGMSEGKKMAKNPTSNESTSGPITSEKMEVQPNEPIGESTNEPIPFDMSANGIQTPNEEMSQELGQGEFTPAHAEEELTRRMDSQQVPDEVIQEIMTLASENPEALQELFKNYPQLLEMLQSDMQNMNGGQI